MKEPRSIVAAPINEQVELERQFEPAIAGTGRYPQYRETGGEGGFQLADYWRAIRKRLWLVLGIAVLFTMLAAIYMARRPNIYQAKAVVQVDLEQNNPDLVTSDRQRPSAVPDASYFNTQLQLLYTDSLLRRVIKEKNFDANKDFQLAVAEGGNSWFRGILRSVGLASGPVKRTEEELKRADSTLFSAEEMATAVRLSPFVELIRRNLSVEPIRESRATTKDTRLIEIRYLNTDPFLAADVTNAIAEIFTVMNQEKRSGTSRKTNDFLQERIATLQEEIKSDEESFAQMNKEQGIIKTTGEQTIVVDRLAGLNKQLLEAENTRKNAEANYKTVEADPARLTAQVEEMALRYTTEQENNLQTFRLDREKTLAALRQQRTKLTQEYQDSAPEVKEVDAQIESLQSNLDKAASDFQKGIAEFRTRARRTLIENLRTKYLQAQKQENEIKAAFDSQFNQAQSQDQGAVKLRLLQQRLDTNKGFLDNLRKQVSSNDVASQGTDNNISVTEPAIPNEQAVSPRRLTTVLAALLLSTLFGMGLALFLEYLDDTIRTTEEIESYLQLPALAAIPNIDSLPKRNKLLLVGGEEVEEKSNSGLLIDNDSNSPLAEAYRQLRTSILLSTAGHAPKSLLVTSSLPSEGKTTTATNTAISLAQTGAKVLIIDADMRRPRLHSVFGVGNGEGLSTLLSSELHDEDIDTAVKQDPGTKLYLLTSGPIPPNPAELIGSQQMTRLFKMLGDKFTHIVVDSPPIASFTDGVLIASMVDGVILVVHSGKSSRQVVRKSRQLLNDIGAKVFGVVLNNVNLRSQDNYYYYQSYYHRDSYHAGDQE
ncbi:MAG TPA: polysaccharide biosynthesis tyrosine autokinase [Sphingorhabdus sp.]|nr:polysaccharide biosynthesis tyrosine autokinase [Sphingorhabdus sp.]